MNQKITKTALLFGVCSMLGGYNSLAVASASPDVIAAVQQSKKKVTGVVNDAMGPVIGASVMEKGTSNGCVTDLDGNFQLSVSPGATLVISYIGYITQEIKVGGAIIVHRQP